MTEPLEEDNNPDLHLELRFSHGLRTNVGFVLRKDLDTSNIVLVNKKGISKHHYAITFKNDFKDVNYYRLVVHDLKSRCRTSVIYNDKAGSNKGGVRRDFR